MIVSLYDLRLFDATIRCENELNNEVKIFKLECSNCGSNYCFLIFFKLQRNFISLNFIKQKALFTEPFITPSHAIATLGSTVHFACQKALNAREPDRIEWRKKSSKAILDQFGFPDTFGTSSVLEINNITNNSADYYYCCLLYSPISPLVRYSDFKIVEDDDETLKVVQLCSSVQLELRETMPLETSQQSTRTRNIIFIIVAISVFIMGLLAFLVNFFYAKTKFISNARKAANTLKQVQLKFLVIKF